MVLRFKGGASARPKRMQVKPSRVLNRSDDVCPQCHGTGKDHGHPCEKCHGTGHVSH